MRLHRRALRFPGELAKLPKSVKIISLVVFIYYLGWGIAEPFLPIYFKQIFGNYTSVGFVTGLLYILSLLWTLPIGDLTDKISKKKFIGLILFLYAPIGPLLLVLKNFFDFVLFRVYHSFLASSLWTCSEAYVREHSPKNKTAEAIGLFDTSSNISLIIGPILGGLLIIKFGFSIFIAISVFALLAFVLSFFIIDRRGGKFIDGLKEVIIKDRVFKKEITDFLHKTELIKFSIPLFFISFCAEFLIMSLSLFLNELGADFVLIGLIFSLFHIPVIFESYFSVVADKKGKKPIMLKGLVFGSLFFLLLFFTENIVFLFSICFFLSLCFSAIIPSLQGKITELMPKKSVGELTGVVRSVGLLGNGLGPIAVGIISDIFGLRFAFLLGSLIFLFLTAFTLLLKF